MFNGSITGGSHPPKRDSQWHRTGGAVWLLIGYPAAILALLLTLPLAAATEVTYSERLVIEQVFGDTGFPAWADGSPAQARFHSPAGLDFDAQGALFVADRMNRAVRKISPTHEVSTVSMPPEPAASAPVDLIFDADVGDDIDDVGDLAILHRLADIGRVNILATLGSNLQDYSSAAIEILNRHFGRPELPIAVPKSGTSPFLRWAGPFMKSNWPSLLQNPDDAPDSLHLYREILASRPDASVTILALGQLRNIYSLWNSPADQISPFTGRELLERKVKEIVVAAGFFPSSTNIYAEYNVFTDIQASMVLNQIKTVPIVYAGIELATPGGGVGTIFFGGNIADRPEDDIVRKIFQHVYATQPQQIYGMGGGRAQRPAWGSIALLYAVSGLADNGTNLFSYSAAGTNYIRSPDWHNIFTETPSGNQRYLLKAQPDSFYTELLDDLLMTSGLDQQPTDGPLSTARLGHVHDVSVAGDGSLAIAETYGYSGGVRIIRDDSIEPPEILNSSAQLAGALHVASSADGALFATSGDLWPQALWHASSSSGNWDRIGVSGFADDEFSAAAFAEPLGLDLDYEGNLLIADAANHAIRKATLGSGGSVSTIAGHPSSPGWIDGPAEQARFLAPVDVASAPGQSVYVLQSAAHSLAEAPDAPSALRRISSSGNVTSVLLPETIGAVPVSELRFSTLAVDGTGRIALASARDHIVLIGSIEPILSYSITANTIALLWTDPSADYVLETTANLSPPADWTPLTATLDGNTRSVTVPTNQRLQFFRLRNQK